MNDQRIRNIIIAGGGTAGWMAAAALSRALPSAFCQISLVESEDIGTIGVGEATIPTLHWFNQLVGLDETSLMSRAQATYKLGIMFEGWRRQDDAYFHPFGRYGGAQDGNFHHRWLKGLQEGLDIDLAEFSVTAQAAFQDRFFRPSPDPRALLSNLGYAFHIDAGLYARLLREVAEARGVRRIEGRIEAIERDPQTGFVRQLIIHHGATLSGDLFIDCTGLRALLIEDCLQTGFEDWSHWLACDRALAVQSELPDRRVPYTRSIARPAGWQWQIPLQHRAGNGLVYSSAFLSDADAKARLVEDIDPSPLGEPRLIRFRTGRRRKMWNRNVVAVGLSGGFLEPLESTSIHLIQSGLAKLLALFPDKACDALTAEQYNRLMAEEMEGIRDFLILHYHLNERSGDPLWDYCRHMSPPDTLTYRMEHFKRSGRIVLGSDELFREASWLSVLIGQGLRPSGYAPLTDTLDSDDNLNALRRLQGDIHDAVRNLPSARAVSRPDSAAKPVN